MLCCAFIHCEIFEGLTSLGIRYTVVYVYGQGVVYVYGRVGEWVSG